MVRRLLRSAGFSRSVSDLVGEVLARYGDSSVEVAGLQVRDLAEVLGGLAPEGVTRLLRSSGYPGEVSALVGALLDRYGDPEAAEAAGPQVRVVAGLVEFADEDLLAFLRSWGPVGDERNNVAAQLRVVLGRTSLEPDLVGDVLRTASYSREVSSLVVRLLVRYGDEAVTAPGLQVRDISGLIEAADDHIVGLVRGWDAQQRDPIRLRSQLRAVFARHELDVELAGALAALALPNAEGASVVMADEAVPAQDSGAVALQRVLRAAGAPSDAARLAGRLVQRSADPQLSESTPTIRDIADFMEQADDDLVRLVRTWSGSHGDVNRVRSQFKTVLQRQGVDEGVAGALAGLVLRDSDDVQLAEIVRIGRLARTAEDACVSIAEPAWLQDSRFVEAYEEAKGIAAWGRDIRWRVQTLVKLAAAAARLDGDFVECGVDTGGTARAVMAYLGDDAFDGRTFYLFDTFRGLVPEQLTDEEQALEDKRGDRYPDVSEVVSRNFADKSFVQIVAGAVPDTLPVYEGDRVAYLHIDMNATLPEVEALKFFWPKLAPGATVIFDDYGFPRHGPQRRALDAIAAGFGVEIMMLPTCQGVLIKPCDLEE